MPYRLQDRPTRWKAMAAAIAVTLVIGAAVVSGLNVKTIGRAVEKLQTFDISLPEPPPKEPPPKPKPKPKEAGSPAAPKASPIVAPKPEVRLPTEQVIAAATQAGTGTSSASGLGGAGSGSGAGGSGNGAGSGSGNSPARLVRNLSRSDYRALAGGRMASGSAGLAIRVAANGRVDSCRVEHSSGDSVIDSGLCPLVQSRLRFEPARNARGEPIPFYTHYLARWRR